jgi:UDP-glucose 4-epimerase
MKKKKVLILGGAGFIGLEIAKNIGKEGMSDITIADLCSDSQIDEDFNGVVTKFSINVIKGDFSKRTSFNFLETYYDEVYMLASIVGVVKCIEEPHEVIRVNTALIQNTLEWIVKNKIPKVLFSSSSECYVASTENFNFPVPTSEEVPLSISDISHPRFTYAVTKMLGESAFLNYGRIYGFISTVVRFQNIFGPRMGFKHVIPHLVERFIKNENSFKIYGPNQTRAFCYVEDAAECTKLAMNNKKSVQQIFHVGAPDEITIEELTIACGKYMNYKGTYTDDESYPGSVSRRCPDISKAKSILGYSPKFFWKDGLKITIDWYRKFYSENQLPKGQGFIPPSDIKFKQR